MAAVSMLDFLRTGHFGPVHLGISRIQTRDCLGEPEQWGPAPRAKHNAGVWKYGDIEFYFDNSNTLWMIFSDHVKTLKGGAAMDLNPWVLNGSLMVKQALREFEDAGIPFQRIDWKVDDTTERFRVGVGIDLIFWDEVQYGPNDDDLPTLARPDMTFCGFSYRMEEMKR